jgi:hypothetical protein
MATELGLHLVRMTCFVGHAELGDFSKEQLQPLGGLVAAMVGDPPVGALVIKTRGP